MLINTALVGLGSVNRNLLTILAGKADVLQRDHGIGFRIVLVADSRGVAVDPAGFDPAGIVARKAAGGSTAEFAGYRGAVPVESLLAGIDLVFEASPVDLRTGGPGLALTRARWGRASPSCWRTRGRWCWPSAS